MPSRVDANQKDIVRKIRSIPGWRWVDLTQGAYGKRTGDGLLRAQWMPPGMVLHVEIKTETGKLKPHQKLAASDGSIVVIRSFEDLQRVMDMASRLLDKTGVRFTEASAAHNTYGVAARGREVDD